VTDSVIAVCVASLVVTLLSLMLGDVRDDLRADMKDISARLERIEGHLGLREAKP